MAYFTATLTDPSGFTDTYRGIAAKNKTEARKIIAQIYRRDTPPKSAGFYTFDQNRLAWINERDD